VVDLVGDLGGLGEPRHVDGHLRAHVGKDVEVAVAEGMVQKHAVALGDGGRAADDVHDGDVLRVGAGDAVDGGELADAKGSYEGADAEAASVAVGGVGWSMSC